LSFLGILLAMPMAASAAQIYVTNINDASVSVIDAGTNQVVQTIHGIGIPRGACFSPDGKLAYIVSEEEHTLDVVDRQTTRIINKVQLSSHPGMPAMTKDGKYILIGLNPYLGYQYGHKDPEDSGGEDIVDLTTLKLIKTLPIKEGIHDTFITPDDKYAILGADHGTFAQIVDLKTMEPAGRIEFDAAVLTVAIEKNPDGSTGRLFVELKNFNGFSVVDFAARKELTRVRLPDPMRFMFAGPVRSDSPLQFNPTHGTDISPDGKDLWVGSRATNYLYRYSLPDLKLVGKVQMPIKMEGELPQAGDPHWLVITPDGKTVYTCISHFDYVVAVDIETMKDVAHIPVGDNPGMIMAAPTP
jgi:YVTN family beta-propeller protein